MSIELRQCAGGGISKDKRGLLVSSQSFEVWESIDDNPGAFADTGIVVTDTQTRHDDPASVWTPCHTEVYDAAGNLAYSGGHLDSDALLSVLAGI